MTELPAWSTDTNSLELTEEQYNDLPDALRKLIEVVDGNIIRHQIGSAEYSDIARRLANQLELAKPADPGVRISTGVDVRFAWQKCSAGAFSFRRPDVTIYRCIDRGTKLTTAEALLVVEVVSPGSGYTDTVDKLAEYAYEGIPVYLIVHLDSNLYVKMIQEYRLDWAARIYRLADTHEGALLLESPFSAVVPFDRLDG
ncbi:Uma2 family endonuclease [Nocardia yunnanensis]|uniref:Uma2 family endonuclease n=1 Tax=Nocardia yunnanensis TaxID=2382165 RepID=A0A386ZG86_9NOCA|nr:Uma2 family endonuclease [Nocardia yunnanensis]AYF76450.1 Uma2 family endonuclease [Nocardia yunnanensis]